LIESVTEKTDKLVEVLQGLTGTRVRIHGRATITLLNMSDVEARPFLEDVRVRVLEGSLMTALAARDSSVANLRDELLADVHQAQYLFTFK
jgi:hypothetical protein